MKTAILIDGANTHGAAKHLGYVIDYKAVLDIFTDSSSPLGFYYTALLLESDGTNSLQTIIDWLSYNGYKVVTKESKSFEDKLTGLTKIKGNMDIEIAVHAMELSEYVDRIVLFSGDGDFTCLVRALRMRGIHTTVVSTMAFVADELRRACDVYMDLSQLRPSIEKVFNEGEGRRQRLDTTPRRPRP